MQCAVAAGPKDARVARSASLRGGRRLTALRIRPKTCYSSNLAVFALCGGHCENVSAASASQLRKLRNCSFWGASIKYVHSQGGVPKKLISVGDKGADGVKKSEIFVDLIYGSPLGPSTLSLRGGK